MRYVYLSRNTGFGSIKISIRNGLLVYLSITAAPVQSYFWMSAYTSFLMILI